MSVIITPAWKCKCDLGYNDNIKLTYNDNIELSGIEDLKPITTAFTYSGACDLIAGYTSPGTYIHIYI